MPQAQLVDDIDCDWCVRRCGPRYYLEKPANSRMDAARDHVHQLHRRSVSQNAEEFDFTAYHIQLGLGNWIPRSVIERENWCSCYSVLHGDHD